MRQHTLPTNSQKAESYIQQKQKAVKEASKNYLN